MNETAGYDKFAEKHPRTVAKQHVSLVQLNEAPGEGLRGTVSGHPLQITSRSKLNSQTISGDEQLPPSAGGLECVVLMDHRYAATLRFRDASRADSRSFVKHLGPKHHFGRVMIVSGDRESEVRYLADQVGITEIDAQKNSEEKRDIVRQETAKAKTLYVGDALSIAGMLLAALGHLRPVSGAISQEIIDVLAVLNALRAALPPKVIHDL